MPQAVNFGRSNDALDEMDFLGGFEDPGRYETVMEKIYKDAETDEGLAYTLKHACLEKNPADTFAFYKQTTVPGAIAGLMERFGIQPSQAVVDVGAGRGHATHALYSLGFKNISAMDPNSHFASGTGYLASLKGHGISIINNLADWRGISERFDAAFSTSTVHHWQHIPHCAIDLRRTLKPGALWFMVTEYFANTGTEFAALLGAHPIARRYGTYEWPYSASAYADLIEGVGFALEAVIPLHYDENKFYMVPLPAPERFNGKRFTKKVDRLLWRPRKTVEAFWDEVHALRKKPLPTNAPLHDLYASRFYTNPQVMVFRRIAV